MMRTITEYCKQNIYISNILERNEKIYPQIGKYGKFVLFAGDHCKKRQQERDVTDSEIIDAFKSAWSQLNKLYKEKTIKKSEDYGRDTHFIIIDARNNRAEPVNIAAFIYHIHSTNTLSGSSFIVKTVFKGENFKGTLRDDKDVEKIFLY